MFEVRNKDYLGRIGYLTLPHGKVQTPLMLPVINPIKQIISPDEMVELGAEAFITNAYLIYRDEKARKIAESKGLHKLIGFNGPIMTDSGSFQLMKYGQVSVTNEEITSFQEKIGSDIGVFLDIPVKKGTYEETSKTVDITIERAQEHISYRKKKDILWAGPIQGAPYTDLIEKSATALSKLPFSIHPIGSVVPLLEQYRFDDVIKAIITTKKNTPINRPIHLFGAGHPFVMAIAVLLGVDIFDSAAYVLYAKKDRYLTTTGTEYLSDLQYLPCSCEVCRKYTARELKELDKQERSKLLAKHNLNICFEELKRIKQAIIDGRLLELAITRAMSHPSLTKTLKIILSKESSTFIEKYDPITKNKSRRFLYPLQVNEPIVVRYQKRLQDRFYQWNDTLLIVNEYQRFSSSTQAQVINLSSIFGVIPWELKSVYPLTQYSSAGFDPSPDILNTQEKILEKIVPKFKKVIVHPSVTQLPPIIEKCEKDNLRVEKERANDTEIVRAIIDYQFGTNCNTVIKKLHVERSKKTTIIRRFFDNGELAGTLRASDFTIVPSKPFIEKIHQQLKSPNLRVFIETEAIPFIMEGRDLFSKFVTDVDPNIRAGDEVIIVDNDDNFIGYGRAVLSATEMKFFERGIAVKTR